MGKYYPPDYYSFGNADAMPRQTQLVFRLCRWLPDPLLSLLRRATGSFSLGALVEVRAEVRSWMGNGYSAKASVLDVGCGSGAKPRLLALAGFAAEGLDPFYTGPNPKECLIHRCELNALARTYEVLSFDKSFEHVAQPAEVLRAAFERVRPGGVCVLTVPKLPSDAFDRYGACWYALDAPRHYFVPSVDGLTRLAKEVGFKEVTIRPLEYAEAFLWSEAYRRGIPRQRGTLSGLIPEEELRALSRDATEAFRRDRSCLATFVLRKAG